MQGLVDSFKGQPMYLFAIMAGLVLVFWWRGKVNRQMRNNRKRSVHVEKQVFNNEQPIQMRTASSSEAKPVYFNFSGHAWDAYEVLGVTSACSDRDLEVAYKSSLSQVDKESQEFIEMAFKAILQKRP